MVHLPTGTVTFLFTDIEGSTRLWGQFPEAMKAGLARHDQLLRAVIEAHGGYVFKTIGDAFCAAFDTAVDALSAAAAAQQTLHHEAWGELGELRVRMALHTGMAEEREGDYFGPPLNRVARLLSTGHGGQILLSLATKELVRDHLPQGATLRDLGEHRLKDLVRPEQVFQLLHPDLQADFPVLKSLDSLPNNLPLQLTSFVGREREIEVLKQLMGKSRLVTLVGPGGTGKTRLSLQVAADFLDQCADGVWLIELAPLAYPEQVIQAVAISLGIREEPGQPLLATLISHLRGRQLLLVLDNCEHLVTASAKLAEDLLHSCPQLRLLASSREALSIGGEHVFPVPPLALPDPRHLPPIETLAQYEALRLFIDRAVAVDPGFSVTNQNAPAVAKICQQLDGIPLAIELAAARVKVLPVEQIAARLGDRFRLLISGSRTAQRRQQTLQAAIDWSFDLLSDPERVLLRRVSVFVDGCTLEAAESVCSGEGVEKWEVLDLLARLVDKSLVVMSATEGAARYGLLESIREYGRLKLIESGEEHRLREQHLTYHRGLVSPLNGQGLTVSRVVEDNRLWDPALFGALERGLENLRAAIEWCHREHPGEDVALDFVAVLTPFWIIRGYPGEGLAYVNGLLATVDPAHRSPATALALYCAGYLAAVTGNHGAAWDLIEKSQEINHENGLSRESLSCLVALGDIARCQGDYRKAWALLSESLAAARDLDEGEHPVLDAKGLLGIVAMARGDYGTARSLIERVLQEYGAKMVATMRAWSIYMLGDIAKRSGDFDQAQTRFEEALAIFEKERNRRGMGWSLYCLGHIQLYRSNSTEAQRLIEEGVGLLREVGDRRGLAAALRALGEVALRQTRHEKTLEIVSEGMGLFREAPEEIGNLYPLELLAWTLASTQPAQAARLLGAAEVYRESRDAPLPPADRPALETYISILRDQLGEDGFAAAWSAGRNLSLEQAAQNARTGQ